MSIKFPETGSQRVSNNEFISTLAALENDGLFVDHVKVLRGGYEIHWLSVRKDSDWLVNLILDYSADCG